MFCIAYDAVFPVDLTVPNSDPVLSNHKAPEGMWILMFSHMYNTLANYIHNYSFVYRDDHYNFCNHDDT